MFKNIQKYLLLHYPLLWNTKFVPMLIIGITFNILSFFFGYVDGKINFDSNKNSNFEDIFIPFSIFIVIIIVIVWLVYYLKNNAFKSFYSKTKYSLFYEWFQVFFIFFFLISFSIPYMLGKNLRERSYYSIEEATKKCEVISKSNMFIDGNFGPTKYRKVKDSEGYENDVYDDFIIFEGKKYDQYSLLNRSSYEFTLISNKDSINEFQIKKALVNNNTFLIKQLMSDYLKILNEHGLETNMNTDIWFSKVYKNHPTFKDFIYIHDDIFTEGQAVEAPYYDEYREERTLNKKYSKYYIQHDILTHNYDKISSAYTNSLIDYEILLTLLYVAFALSIILFSFKVTSGKSWLIALVIVGVLNILFGIISIFQRRNDYLYPLLCLITVLGIIIYFAVKYNESLGKGKSNIALNIILWTFTWIIPIIYFIVIEFNQNDYSVVQGKNQHYYSTYNWLSDHIAYMFAINFITSVIILFFLSNVIRKWKGIAED